MVAMKILPLPATAAAGGRMGWASESPTCLLGGVIDDDIELATAEEGVWGAPNVFTGVRRGGDKANESLANGSLNATDEIVVVLLPDLLMLW